MHKISKFASEIALCQVKIMDFSRIKKAKLFFSQLFLPCLLAFHRASGIHPSGRAFSPLAATFSNRSSRRGGRVAKTFIASWSSFLFGRPTRKRQRTKSLSGPAGKRLDRKRTSLSPSWSLVKFPTLNRGKGKEKMKKTEHVLWQNPKKILIVNRKQSCGPVDNLNQSTILEKMLKLYLSHAASYYTTV